MRHIIHATFPTKAILDPKMRIQTKVWPTMTRHDTGFKRIPFLNSSKSSMGICFMLLHSEQCIWRPENHSIVAAGFSNIQNSRVFHETIHALCGLQKNDEWSCCFTTPLWHVTLYSFFQRILDNSSLPYCLKITQNVAFEFLNLGIFHQFLSY